MLNLRIRSNFATLVAPYVPLHVNIATLIAVLLATVVGGIVYYDQSRGRQMALIEAQAAFQSFGETLRSELRALRGPIESVVEATAAMVDMMPPDTLFSVDMVDLLARRIQETDGLYALYYGDEDGNFVLVFNLAISAPGADADFLAWIIRRVDETSIDQTVVMLNDDLEILSTNTRQNNGYDPRIRPWYHAAMQSDAAIQTAPYIYFETNDIGITIARQVRSGNGVVGGDLTLGTMSDLLGKHRLSENSIAVIFNEAGSVLAAAEIDHVLTIRRRDDRPVVQQQSLATIGDAPYGALSRLFASGVRDGVHEAEENGHDWVIWLSPISLGQGAPALLSIASPAAEVNAQVDRRFRIGLLIAFGGLASGLLLTWAVAKAISRPIGRLTDEAYQMRTFDLSDRSPIDSRILEVHKLSQAVLTLKRSLKDFARYVPAQLVRRLVSGEMSADIGGVRSEVTLLFTDIQDFTAISETTEPMALMQEVSDYLATITKPLTDNGGTIDKYIGDAVMAMWNAPVAQPDHVEQACRAALAANAAIGPLNASRVATGRQPLLTRFGLHVGEAVVGNVGSPDRMNYTILGATVNLAARLEGLNKYLGTTILISDAVEARTRGTFLTRPVDRVRPKGASVPVTVHELIDHSPASEDQAAFLASWRDCYALFLERDWTAALDTLQAHIERHPGDAPARALRQRAEHYARTPPPPDWDGVFDVDEK